MKSEDIKIEREVAFTDDWYMVRKMEKTPTYADAIEWADQHPNWIKVTDRLPEVSEKPHNHGLSDYVLVAVYMCSSNRYRCVIDCYCPEYNMWCHSDEYAGEYSHWMPIILPKED